MADSIHIRMAKMVQRQGENASNRIRAIAANFGAQIPDNFLRFHLHDQPIEMILQIVENLMAKECTSLRREGIQMDVLMLPVLRLYLATGPRKVDLTAFLSFCPKLLKYEYLKFSVNWITEKAADDIEELSLVHTDRNGPYFSHTADDELLQALGKLKRLKVLRIEEICVISLIDLIQLCQNLPNLEYLHFNINDYKDQLAFNDLDLSEKLKNAMPKLQVFLFELQERKNTRILLKCCAENLPNLRVIETFSSRFSSFEDYESKRDTIACAPGSSNLRHLMVDFFDVESGNVDISHLPLAFPLITHLKIYWSLSAANEADNLTTLLQLTHLESLDFINVPKNIFHLFVKKFGPNLREISITYDDDDDHHDADGDAEMVECSASTDCSFGQLLESCPKLERLAFMKNFEEDLEPIKFFSNLKEIRVDCWRSGDKNIRLTDIIVRAPNLEKITLDSSCIDYEELGTLIGDREMLGELKELHFESYMNSIDNFQHDNFRKLSNLIKCFAASKPTINVITFDVHHYFKINSYAALARSLKSGKRTNDEIDGITQFFESANDSSEFAELFVDEELIATLETCGC